VEAFPAAGAGLLLTPAEDDVVDDAPCFDCAWMTRSSGEGVLKANGGRADEADEALAA
jgi:hypothetical protein